MSHFHIYWHNNVHWAKNWKVTTSCNYSPWLSQLTNPIAANKPLSYPMKWVLTEGVSLHMRRRTLLNSTTLVTHYNIQSRDLTKIALYSKEQSHLHIQILQPTLRWFVGFQRLRLLSLRWLHRCDRQPRVFFPR